MDARIVMRTVYAVLKDVLVKYVLDAVDATIPNALIIHAYAVLRMAVPVSIVIKAAVSA